MHKACVLRKLHSYDDDAHEHFVKHVKNGAYVNIQVRPPRCPYSLSDGNPNLTLPTSYVNIQVRPPFARLDVPPGPPHR